MKVASILKAKGSAVATTPPRTSIATAARLLRDQRIGALVVSEDDVTVLGIITERDIVHELADRGPALLELPVSLVMTRAPITCTPDDDIPTLMRQMTRLRVRHLPVVVGERLQGIVSIGDVVKHRLDELETEANVLREAFLARQQHTTVRFDRLVKARLYARAGIAEFWLCLAMDGGVEVYRSPGAEGYASVTQHRPGQVVTPLAFPDVSFGVSDFFV